MNAKMVVVLVLMVFVTGVAFAGQSVKIRVSCTIPAIPGVNVPSVTEEKQVNVNEHMMMTQMEEDLNSEENQTALVQQEEPSTGMQLAYAESTDKTMTLQTIYGR